MLVDEKVKRKEVSRGLLLSLSSLAVRAYSQTFQSVILKTRLHFREKALLCDCSVAVKSVWRPKIGFMAQKRVQH